MIHRFFLALIAALTLIAGGCTTVDQRTEIVEVSRVVIPPEELFKCPEIREYSNWQTLTNYEVAELILQLSKNNEICKENIQSIRRYLKEAKERLNG